MRANEKITIIDVREKDEIPFVDEFQFIEIPLSKFANSISSISTENKIVIFCNTGKRSLKAIKILNELLPGANAFSLTGGINKWKNQYHIQI